MVTSVVATSDESVAINYYYYFGLVNIWRERHQPDEKKTGYEPI